MQMKLNNPRGNFYNWFVSPQKCFAEQYASWMSYRKMT